MSGLKKMVFLHNSFSPLSIHQVPQINNITLCTLFTVFSGAIHLQNSQMVGT